MPIVPAVGALPPTTTHQEDLTVAGQRRINVIWEVTQAFIAISVVLANMVVAVYQGLLMDGHREHPIILSSSLFLVVGFYFSRTNHSAIGGIGKKATATEEYSGR